MSDPFEQHDSRVERRRAHARKRARKRRNVVLATVVSLVVAAGLCVAGVLIYKRVAGSNPPQPEISTVIVPEGLTNKQTAERIDTGTDGGISAGSLLAATKTGTYDYAFLEGSDGNLEGFLFPKTYDISEEDTAVDVVTMMLDQFGKETDNLDWSRAGTNGVTRYQTVIIASLIEKEAKLPEERPVISSVIYNRLRANMKLQIDATVQYALGEWKPELTYDDLEVDSPYNTYKVLGLPPAPICNPGFESIRAALYPAHTDYLYYLLTSPEGKHSFTSDYDQFVKWKEQQGQ